MAYLKLKYKDIEIELTAEVIRDFKTQLVPQIKEKNLTIAELQELMDALGISPKSIINFLTKK